MKYVVTFFVALIAFYLLAFSGLAIGPDCYWFGVTKFVFGLV